MASLLETPTALNLRRLMAVRLVLLVLLIPGFALLGRHVALDVPVAALAAVIAVTVCVTLVSWWALGARHASAGRRAVVTQLGIDIAALTAILYCTGGWTNPLISLYLVPVAVAAATLSAVETWICAAICVAAYTALTQVHVPLFYLHGDHVPGFALHVAGMWLTFLVAAGLLAYFGTTMAATLRQQEHVIALAREQNLRNEQILGVAALAAGTAHEMSTPLGSIAVIASELESTTRGETRAELKKLLDQVDICRDALNRLRDAATPEREPLRADRLVDELHSHFTLLRPTVPLTVDCDPASAAPCVTVDTTLRQALLNLLNNAADASPDHVVVRGRWYNEHADIEILDRGPGLTSLDAVSGKGGMGLGLLLANASIDRAGGRVFATSRDGGGLHIRVTLPVITALADAP